MREKVPKPLGFDNWTYRCEAICGETLNTLSPFTDRSYEESLARQISQQALREYTKAAIAICDLLTELHSIGHVHGELTLHNAMFIVEENRGMLINQGGSSPTANMSTSEKAAEIAKDFQEPYRDLILTQHFIGALDNEYARKSLEFVGEWFPINIAVILSKLPSDENENKIS